MFEYIENLRNKPDHIKKRFAFLVSFSFTFLVFAGWIASYSFKPSEIIANKDGVVEKPVSSLTASIVGAYNDIKSVIFNSNKVEYFSTAIEVTGGDK
ncbi:MAG: hypothetical protein AAB637_02505 [Patescibacteria group bacterium]